MSAHALCSESVPSIQPFQLKILRENNNCSVITVRVWFPMHPDLLHALCLKSRWESLRATYSRSLDPTPVEKRGFSVKINGNKKKNPNHIQTLAFTLLQSMTNKISSKNCQTQRRWGQYVPTSGPENLTCWLGPWSTRLPLHFQQNYII